MRVTVPPPNDITTDGVTLKGPRGQVEAAAQDIRYCLEEEEDKAMRQRAKTAKDGRIKVTMPVAPNRRRHVLGPGGETLHALLHDYQGVQVMVPPPKDTEAQTISIVGPKDQVSAVTAAISRHLEEVEAKLQEVKRDRKERKKDHAKVTVPVAPSKRGHVVGHEGEILRSLEKQFEGVRVTVPPPKDTNTRHVTLQGPKDKVHAAAAFITRRVEEDEERRLKERRAGPRTPTPHTLADYLPALPERKRNGKKAYKSKPKK